MLTGQAKYLEPYQVALGGIQTNLSGLKQLTLDNPSQQQRLADIQALSLEKLAELKQTIELRRSQGVPAALAVVAKDAGRNLRDQIRRRIAEAQMEETRLLQQRAAAKTTEGGKTLQALWAGGVLSFLLLVSVCFCLKQENRRRMEAEAELRHHRDHLQELVAARTEALNRANAQLNLALTSAGMATFDWDIVRDTRHWSPGGHALVWIGLAEHDQAKSVRSVAHVACEERFRLATAATHAMVYDLDVVTLRVNALDGLRELLGYELREGELTLDWWDRRIHPDDLTRCHAAFQQMHSDGRGQTLHYRVRHQDGRTLDGTRGNPFMPVGCAEILDEVKENLDLAIAESGAVITHDPLPTLLADRTQLTQLFQNLFSNAIKFHRPPKAPRIHLSAARQDRGWRLSVRDNGIGIDPRYFERIFIVFQRLHNRDEYPGTGIGLAIRKKIVERHGGRLWVESEPGNGATFHFMIPEER